MPLTHVIQRRIFLEPMSVPAPALPRFVPVMLTLFSPCFLTPLTLMLDLDLSCPWAMESWSAATAS